MGDFGQAVGGSKVAAGLLSTSRFKWSNDIVLRNISAKKEIVSI